MLCSSAPPSHWWHRRRLAREVITHPPSGSPLCARWPMAIPGVGRPVLRLFGVWGAVGVMAEDHWPAHRFEASSRIQHLAGVSELAWKSLPVIKRLLEPVCRAPGALRIRIL